MHLHQCLRILRLLLATFASSVVVGLWAQDAQAYGWMIRHAYAGCAQCHADPSGGGLLTSYGRAQSELLLRTLYGPEPEEPDVTLGRFAWGLYDGPPNDTLLLGGDARTLFYSVSAQGAPSTSKLLWMQADFHAQLRVSRVRANASVGYAAEGALPAAVTRWSEANVVSRTHWLGLELDGEGKNLLRAGRIALPFGLRSIEHTLWARTTTQTDINSSQQHGIAFSHSGDRLRGEGMAILGNLQLRPWTYHDYGVTGYLEITPATSVAVGVSSLVTHAEVDLRRRMPMWRHAHGLFARYAPVQWLVLVTEHDLVIEAPDADGSQGLRSAVGYVTADFEPLRGLHLTTTLEEQVLDLGRGGFSWGSWVGASWFLLPHVDVRGDVILQSLAGANEDARTQVTTLLAQMHVFL